MGKVDEVCVLYRKKDFKLECNLDNLDAIFYLHTENVLIETQDADVVVSKDELIAIAEKAKELGWL